MRRVVVGEGDNVLLDLVAEVVDAASIDDDGEAEVFAVLVDGEPSVDTPAVDDAPEVVVNVVELELIEVVVVC